MKVKMEVERVIAIIELLPRVSELYIAKEDLIKKLNYHSFLDNLRESGETNMLGSIPYLEKQFPELNYKKARSVLCEWVQTYR